MLEQNERDLYINGSTSPTKTSPRVIFRRGSVLFKSSS